jgi:hypothetical protein
MADSKIHIMGEMVVACREVQSEHFNALCTVLDAIEKRPVLIVSPLQRYIVAGCCQYVRHVANTLDRVPGEAESAAGPSDSQFESLSFQHQKMECPCC